jgi:glyoxylase-like metal-dependent hydrolase (beta-lactamase superfamily II)
VKTVDKRVIFLSRLEVKDIILKHLCELNPGYGPVNEREHGDAVDLGDLPQEVEVVLSPVPVTTVKVHPGPNHTIGDIEVIPSDARCVGVRHQHGDPDGDA